MKYIKIDIEESEVKKTKGENCCTFLNSFIIVVTWRIFSISLLAYQIYNMSIFINNYSNMIKHDDEEYYFSSECYNFTQTGKINDITKGYSTKIFVVPLTIFFKLFELLVTLYFDIKIYKELRNGIKMFSLFKSDNINTGIVMVTSFLCAIFTFVIYISAPFGIIMTATPDGSTLGTPWFYECKDNFIPTIKLTPSQISDVNNTLCVYAKANVGIKISCINVIETTKYGFLTYHKTFDIRGEMEKISLTYFVISLTGFFSKIIHACSFGN